ncbi:hypothetical protein ACLB2K_021141 [Fragaria x ananassa]
MDQRLFELVLLEMREEFNRATAWDIDKELYFVREIGRNTFALPEANVLLEFTFHASDVNLGNSGHVVHRDWIFLRLKLMPRNTYDSARGQALNIYVC